MGFEFETNSAVQCKKGDSDCVKTGCQGVFTESPVLQLSPQIITKVSLLWKLHVFVCSQRYFKILSKINYNLNTTVAAENIETA